MSDNVFVIPATIKVGTQFPPYLPLGDGSLKPTPECTQDEVAEAVEECRNAAQSSRARLEAAYRDHLKDLEVLAHLSAYLERYQQWQAVRDGGEVRETLWHVDPLE
jgi:hypothetical protein